MHPIMIAFGFVGDVFIYLLGGGGCTCTWTSKAVVNRIFTRRNKGKYHTLEIIKSNSSICFHLAMFLFVDH